nr:peroxidase 20 [Tanacetum cinerariifolium]
MIPGTDLHCFDVHNDGYFFHLPLTYVNGVIFEMVVQRMPYEQFAEYLEEKCENYFQGLYYQVPNIDLERGLVMVSNDRALSYMFDVEKTFGRLNLYLDHLDIAILEYLSQTITNEMDACVLKKICPPKKRYCNDFFVDEMVDQAEMEVEQHGGSSHHPQKPEGVETRISTIDKDKDATEGVEARTSTTNKGKEKVSQDATEVVKARRSTVDKDSNNDYESKFDNDDDSDYHSDNMPADNVRGDTFEDHDIYMNELLKSLKTANEDGITEDPFISVEKHAGKKYVTVDQFKKCLTNYALENGFSLWYEIISGQRVVAKCRQRPPRLYVLEKDFNPESTIKLGVIVNPDDKTYFDRFWHVIPAGGNLFESMYSIVLPPKPRKISGRPIKKRIRYIGEGGSSTRISKVGSQASCSNCKKTVHNKASCKEPILEQTPKPKGVPGRLRKNQSNVNLEDYDVVLKVSLRDEGASRSRGGVGRSRGCASGSKGGVSGSRGHASGSKRGASGSRGGASGSKGVAYGSKRKVVPSAGT